MAKYQTGLEGEAKKARRRAQTQANQAKYREGTGDVGEIPKCKNPRRRAKALKSVKNFCEIYKADEFTLKWSNDHLKVLKKTDRVILHGEMYGEAMPRGSGKTTIAETAAECAILGGYRKFALYIGSDKEAAVRSLESIKVDLMTNDLLLEDFPEICIPVRALEGLAQRAHSQTYRGEPTNIRWGIDKIVLPTIGKSNTNGSVIKAAGLTGGLRGIKHKRSDGASIRPDLGILDDIQTDASAASLSQCNTRERLVGGAVMKLAGPGKKLAAIAVVTVIKKDDVADRLLNRMLHPRWQGDRMKALYAFPENMKLWEEYGKVWQDGLREEDGGKAGNAFYKENKLKLDKGADVAWPERIDEGDHSALQGLMNYYIENEHGFMCEMQNEPPDEFDDPDNKLHIEGLRERCNGFKLRDVPTYCNKIVAFADVGTVTGINFVVMALGDNFTGAIIDYGKMTVDPKVDELGAIWATLTKVTDRLAQPYAMDGGGEMHVSNIGIDSGYQTDLIYRFCRENKHANILIPCKGAYVKPGGKLYSSKAKGAVKGTEYIYAKVRDAARPVRLMRYNSNYWRNFGMERMKLPLGSNSAISVYGKSSTHRTFFEHLTSEYRTIVTVENKNYPTWDCIPNRENHLWDAYIGCCVLGNFNGVDPMGKAVSSSSGGRKRRSYSNDGVK